MLDPLNNFRGDVTAYKGFLALPSSSTNQGSIVKDIRPIILSDRIHWFYSKGKLNDLPRNYTPLDIIQELLGY